MQSFHSVSLEKTAHPKLDLPVHAAQPTTVFDTNPTHGQSPNLWGEGRKATMNKDSGLGEPLYYPIESLRLKVGKLQTFN